MSPLTVYRQGSRWAWLCRVHLACHHGYLSQAQALDAAREHCKSHQPWLTAPAPTGRYA